MQYIVSTWNLGNKLISYATKSAILVASAVGTSPMKCKNNHNHNETLQECRQGPSSQLLMLRRVPWPPESGCRKCRGPKKCLLNLKLPMSGFCSRPVYLKTSLTRNSFTQITGTPSKPELKARGAVTNLWATKVQTFPVLCKKYQAIVNSFI